MSTEFVSPRQNALQNSLVGGFAAPKAARAEVDRAEGGERFSDLMRQDATRAEASRANTAQQAPETGQPADASSQTATVDVATEQQVSATVSVDATSEAATSDTPVPTPDEALQALKAALTAALTEARKASAGAAPDQTASAAEAQDPTQIEAQVEAMLKALLSAHKGQAAVSEDVSAADADQIESQLETLRQLPEISKALEQLQLALAAASLAQDSSQSQVQSQIVKTDPLLTGGAVLTQAILIVQEKPVVAGRTSEASTKSADAHALKADISTETAVEGLPVTSKPSPEPKSAVSTGTESARLLVDAALPAQSAQTSPSQPTTPTPSQLPASPAPMTAAQAQPAPAPAQQAPVSQLSAFAAQNIAAMSAHIARHLSAKSTDFTMELYPADLGRVDVRLSVGHDGNLTAALSFDSPVAESQFRAQADDLRRQLEAQGFQLSDSALSFASRGDGRQQQPSDGQAQPGETPDDLAAPLVRSPFANLGPSDADFSTSSELAQKLAQKLGLTLLGGQSHHISLNVTA